MRVVIVYESMFGNTRQVAEAIGARVARADEVLVVPVENASAELVKTADLLVVGGPTHAHGMSRPSSRRAAVEMAGKPGSGLILEPGADGIGLREWLGSLGRLTVSAAAFDTRIRALPIFTGRASRRIDRLLRRSGARIVAAPTSFFVDRTSRLTAGELARAHQWGKELAHLVDRTAAPGVGG